MPSSMEQWRIIEQGFKQHWNFPHCIGAMDGKHIVLQSPKHSGSQFFNYKGFFSIVLFALVDARYSFIFVDVGCQGRISDGGVFRNTTLFQGLSNNSLNLPPVTHLPSRTMPIPYVITADDAFPLQENIMKPYGGTHEKGSKERIFNYRLSRAHRISENVFGIVSSVFRVLWKPMLVDPEKAEVVVLACVYLHNFLRKSKTSKEVYTPTGTFDSEDKDTGELIEGSWRRQFEEEGASFRPLERVGRKTPLTAKLIRDEFADYFKSGVGQVPWQDKFA